MADVKQYIADEITDQVMKSLKDQTTKKLLRVSKQQNLSDVDVQAKLRELGFKEIANDPAKFKQFRRMSKLPMSDFKARLARILVGVGGALSKEKINKFLSTKGRKTRIAGGTAFTIFRGSAKDFAEKTARNSGYKRLIEDPQLMKNIAKSLKEKNI